MASGYINLTTRCPHNCINCPIPSSTLDCGELTLEEIYATIDFGIKNGADSIVLSGGEPTFHTRFFDVVKYLSSTNVKISMLTTAISFSNPYFVEKLLKIVSPSRLRIASAIHSFEPYLNDQMTQSNKTFKHILKGLHNAIDAGISTTIKFLITKPTYKTFPEFVRRYCEEFPCNVPLLICNIDYCGRAFEHREELQVAFSESRPYIEEGLEYLMNQTPRRAVHVLDTPLCVISRKYWKFLTSLAGQVIPVYNAPPNKDRKPLDNMVNSNGPKFECCYNCCVRHVCPGTWVTTGELFADELKAFETL